MLLTFYFLPSKCRVSLMQFSSKVARQCWPPKKPTARFCAGRCVERHTQKTGGSLTTLTSFLESSSQQVNLAFLLITDLDVVNFIFVQHHENVWIGYCFFRAVSNQESAVLKGYSCYYGSSKSQYFLPLRAAHNPLEIVKPTSWQCNEQLAPKQQ